MPVISYVGFFCCKLSLLSLFLGWYWTFKWLYDLASKIKLNLFPSRKFIFLASNAFEMFDILLIFFLHFLSTGTWAYQWFCYASTLDARFCLNWIPRHHTSFLPKTTPLRMGGSGVIWKQVYSRTEQKRSCVRW